MAKIIDLGDTGELKRLAARTLEQARTAAPRSLPPGFTELRTGPLHAGERPTCRTNKLDRLGDIVRRQTAALVVLAVVVLLLFGAFLAAPGANSVVPAVTTGAPTVVELSVFGPGPAAEAIAHIAYVDGSENELPPGTYRLSGLAGAQMQIMSEDSEEPAGCRIVVDNVIRAEAVADQDGHAAVCRWEAPK